MDSTAQRAAGWIWSHWNAGTVGDALPADAKPSSRVEGYAAQAELETWGKRAGWKIAATSTAGQKHIGVDGPLAGRIFAERLLSPGCSTSLSTNRMRVAEPEFAFRFSRDLAPRAEPYTVGEVLAAVDSLHLAIELPDSRFADFVKVGGACLVADNACAHELVLGAAVTADWRTLDLARHVVHASVVQASVGHESVGHESVGRHYSREGVGANVLGDPRLALVWCANELSGLGLALRAGEFVTTGTCMVPLEIQPGDHVSANFGVLGSIDVRLA